jgi:mono/diheme cytochrome c family protein
MKKAFGLGLAIAMVAGFASLQAADAAKGKELYTKKCQMCHAADGSGSAANQKKYGDKWKALGSPAVQGMKDDALAKAFKDSAAHKAMAASTTDADLADIVAHMRTLKK